MTYEDLVYRAFLEGVKLAWKHPEEWAYTEEDLTDFYHESNVYAALQTLLDLEVLES